ncbi:unnamed protein product, partial [Ectocarpus sp. 12 AP-2014]
VPRLDGAAAVLRELGLRVFHGRFVRRRWKSVGRDAWLLFGAPGVGGEGRGRGGWVRNVGPYCGSDADTNPGAPGPRRDTRARSNSSPRSNPSPNGVLHPAARCYRRDKSADNALAYPGAHSQPDHA